MNLVYDDIDLSEELKPNSSSPKFDPLWPIGNRPQGYEPPVNLAVVLDEQFASTTINTSVIGFNSGNQNYQKVVTLAGGGNVLRQNLLSGVTATDPLTGQSTNGLQTHWCKCTNYYTPNVDLYYAHEVTYSFDDCHWANAAGAAKPGFSGKYFILDAHIPTDSNSMYFSLTDGNVLRIVASNGPGPWENWTSEPWGLRTNTGEVANGINLKLENGNRVFRSDGIIRTLMMEVDKRDTAAPYCKIRVTANGQILHDNNTNPDFINTDENGWWKGPKDFNIKGFRIYAKSPDDNGVNSRDMTDDPVAHSGYKCGNNIYRYRVLKAV